jgi:hypothetical protein
MSHQTPRWNVATVHPNGHQVAEQSGLTFTQAVTAAHEEHTASGLPVFLAEDPELDRMMTPVILVSVH